MTGNPSEAIMLHLQTSLQAATILNGYNIPVDFALVTRTLLMFDQVNNRYPAAIIQAIDTTPEAYELGYTYEGRLRFRVIIYFKATGSEGPERLANRYLAAVEAAYMQDITRGGHADWTECDTTPTALVFRDNGIDTVFEATAQGSVVFEYDPREVPLLS